MSTFNQAVQVYAAATAPGNYCTLPTVNPGSQFQNVQRVMFWTIDLDGSAIATAALVVAIQTFNFAKGVYIAPSTPAWNAISIAVGTKQLISWTGPLVGIQINIATFGTSTGTFYAQITGVS